MIPATLPGWAVACTLTHWTGPPTTAKLGLPQIKIIWTSYSSYTFPSPHCLGSWAGISVGWALSFKSPATPAHCCVCFHCCGVMFLLFHDVIIRISYGGGSAWYGPEPCPKRQLIRELGGALGGCRKFYLAMEKLDSSQLGILLHGSNQGALPVSSPKAALHTPDL